MRPQVGIVAVTDLLRDACCVVLHSKALEEVSDDTCCHGAYSHDAEQMDDLRKEFSGHHL